MKPAPCAIAASDCIIWAGKNMCFINHCETATITEIIEGLGTEVCKIKDWLNPAEYTYDCLDFDCPPNNFKELFQEVLNYICNNPCSTSASSTSTSNCCSEEIIVPTCFQESGVVQTLSDYVKNIGDKVCEQATTISTQQLAIQQLLNRVSALEAQVEQLISG